MNSTDTFVVTGLAGHKTLAGTVRVSGAKNAALKAMAACILFDGPVTLRNVPHTRDVYTMAGILRALGAVIHGLPTVEDTVEEQEPESFDVSNSCLTLQIDASHLTNTDIDLALAESMRAAVTATGPLLARYGRATFPAPGGCVIGERPIDLFLQAYERMGAQVETAERAYTITVPQNLSGTEIFFNKQAVGPTETLMQAAVLAHGTTILKNCALEPEIESVATWLNACGASISGAGTSTIVIKGTKGKPLSAAQSVYVSIPDRIEAGSFLILGALLARELTITDCCPEHIESLISLLRESGVDIENTSKGSLRVRAGRGSFKALSVKTHEYPGFATDLQAPLSVFLTQATGDSSVFETIFENRFKYTTDLVQIGAKIRTVNAREIVISGPTPLKALPPGKSVKAHDLRAGFALVIAALLATGTTTIENIQQIDRGYAFLEKRLSALGAQIERRGTKTS